MGVPVESWYAKASGSTSPSPSSACAAPGNRRSERAGQALDVPFVELDREVEKEAGAELGEVFAMYGQEGFRRFERRALERVLGRHDRAVIATGGSLVTDGGTYKLLPRRCLCVWLKASPEEHMARVIAQGDMRPFKEVRLRSTRFASSSPTATGSTAAPVVLDTSGKRYARAFPALISLVRHDLIRRSPTATTGNSDSTARWPRSRSTWPRTSRSLRATAQAQQLRPRRRHRARRRSTASASSIPR